MNPPPLPLVPLLLSTAVMTDTGEPGKLLERWGIAAVMGGVAWLLWKRSERQEREGRKRMEALEQERLSVSKELLATQRENLRDMKGLIEESTTAKIELAAALGKLTGSVKTIPCKLKGCAEKAG
jgi:hypothetical protein